MSSFLCNLVLSCVLTTQPVTPLDELYYGTLLYDYYQEQYEDAMIQGLVAEKQARMGDNPVRFEIAKGSFAFANGMYAYSLDTFSALENTELSALDKQRLAFHLAREYFRREDWENLKLQVDLIRLDKTWLGRQLVHPEVEFMRSEIAIHEGDFEQARSILDSISEKNSLRAYGLFNLGVALRHSGISNQQFDGIEKNNFEKSFAIFVELSQMPVFSADAQDIVQRARLALAQLRFEAIDSQPMQNENALEDEFLADNEIDLPPAVKIRADKRKRWWSVSKMWPFGSEDKGLGDDFESAIANGSTGSASAELILRSLPGTGRYRNLALATYASMAMQDADHDTASRIWQSLNNQEHWTAITASARLGLPMSLEQMYDDSGTNSGTVLAAYQQAEQMFTGRLSTLQTISQQAEDATWVGEFLSAFANPEQSDETLTEAMLMWRQEIGHADWLQWLSTESVHGLLADWLTLKEMAQFLTHMPVTLESLNAVSKEQKRRAGAARMILNTQGMFVKRDRQIERISTLSSSLEYLKTAPSEFSNKWMMAISNEEQSEMSRQLSAMQDAANLEKNERKRANLVSRVERLRGLLFFDLVDNKSTRLRSIGKQLEETSVVLSEIEESLERVNKAEEVFDNGVAIDFHIFETRAQLIGESVNDALADRQTLLAKEIREGMQREIRQVEKYLLIARIAIARTTDQLAINDEGQIDQSELQNSW